MAMTQIPRDFLDLLKLLNQHGVKYLVIGGYAVVLHGHNRMTGDLDLFIELSPENAEAFCAAYHEFGLGRGEVTAADFLEEGKLIRAGFEPMRLEILNRISGVAFEECYSHRVEIEIEGVLVKFIGRDQLIANKRASGRDKDLLDVEKLTKGAIKGRRNRKK
ncbi:MAG: nucleotidyltransferase [Planctomycetaceae bacterium]|nr:nucleotidyltransferase [Planctomycetaceae bacterium]